MATKTITLEKLAQDESAGEISGRVGTSKFFCTEKSGAIWNNHVLIEDLSVGDKLCPKGWPERAITAIV